MVLFTNIIDEIPSRGIPIEQITNCTSIEPITGSSDLYAKMIGCIGEHSYLNVKGEYLTLDNAIMNYINPKQTFERVTYMKNTVELSRTNVRDADQLALVDARSSRIFNRLITLTSLTKLNISYNELDSVPPEIQNLKFLTFLDLNSNNLSSLPPEIGNLTALITLNLRNNRLTSIPDEIGNIRCLKTLNLQGNLLRTLPRNIRKPPLYDIYGDIVNQSLVFHMTKEEFNNLLFIPSSKDIRAKYGKQCNPQGPSWISVSDADIGLRNFLFCDVRIFRKYLHDYHDQVEYKAASCIQKHCRGILLRNHFGLHNPHCEIGKQYIKRMFDLCTS
jgi:Leucine-rich repeat (LRR) protein